MALIELLFATSTWGFGFIATVWAIQTMDSITLSALRFLLAFLLIVILYSLFPKQRHHISFSNLKLSALPGLFLGLTLGLQTWSLEYTSVTNSSFLTTLYVVIVPLVEIFVLRHRISRFHFLWVILALLGTGLMVNFHSTVMNKGDILAFSCAIFASFQIVWLGKVKDKISSPMIFNGFQSFWAFLAILCFTPFYENYYFLPFTQNSLIGFLSLCIGSTVLGFALQVKAQKVISPSLASLIFLLESPFAVFFAILLLKESLQFTQIIGGGIIIISAWGATFGPNNTTKTSH